MVSLMPIVNHLTGLLDRSSTPKPEVVVRAYNLGGYGDMAAAMRVASHLQHSGIRTAILATSPDVFRVLQILSPDVPVITQGTSALQIDVSACYRDSGSWKRIGPPHLFVEELDWNQENRKDHAPLYLKTGLADLGSQRDDELLQGEIRNPMFYRPFREWELPEPGNRHARQLILESMRKTADNLRDLAAILGETDYISFARFRPNITAEQALSSEYITAIGRTANSSCSSYAVGIFAPQTLEDRMAEQAISQSYTVVKSDGKARRASGKRLALIFLGPQTQLTTTSLFLSADVPNLVTGHCSLSDAIYGLIAMDGPGFFYDCDSWETHTFRALTRILEAHSDPQDACPATCFIEGSSAWIEDYKDSLRTDGRKVLAHGVFSTAQLHNLAYAGHVFSSRQEANTYRAKMKAAFAAEINHRFGQVPITGEKDTEGLYVPRGTPFLIQDAAERVVRALIERPQILKQYEESRMSLAARPPPYPQ